MKERQSCSSNEYKSLSTSNLRENFLIDQIFKENEITMVYSHFDRIIIGGCVPSLKELVLSSSAELRSEYFLERREMGIINIGGTGIVIADDVHYTINKYECLYLGKGTKNITFKNGDLHIPAIFYFNSCLAHESHPNVLMTLDNAEPIKLGSDEECNKRTIYKYIHPAGTKSCQLVMGVTLLENGSVWNTMPTHTHERRMEVYLYFDILDDQAVFHMMGPKDETRHIVVRNEEAVISPSWSIHSGVGTKNYSFIWGMCGENQDFKDMDQVNTKDLK